MKALGQIKLKKVPATQVNGYKDNKTFERMLRSAEGTSRKANQLLPMGAANIALLAELQS
ncbi:MAG: hypothetical protein QNL04_10600 [SAR324 cluster bacterium]|nr:hypothetical protein [SAR324 cluster bacterium]